MKNLFVIALIAGALALAMPLAAQGGGGGKGNWGKGKQYKGPNSNGQGNGQGQGGGDYGSDWMKKRIDEIGWGEDGTEERVEPGQTVKDDDKEVRLEAEADKLGLEDKKIRKDFIKYGKLGWQKAEKEDSRWSKVYKKYKDNPEQLEKETAKHKEELAEAWADADESQLKKEILTEEQLKAFQESTKDLREETATDKSARQDEIRARKIEELKKQASDYMKGAGGGTDGKDNEVKKEKKEDDDTKEKKEEEEDK